MKGEVGEGNRYCNTGRQRRSLAAARSKGEGVEVCGAHLDVLVRQQRQQRGAKADVHAPPRQRLQPAQHLLHLTLPLRRLHCPYAALPQRLHQGCRGRTGRRRRCGAGDKPLAAALLRRHLCRGLLQGAARPLRLRRWRLLRLLLRLRLLLLLLLACQRRTVVAASARVGLRAAGSQLARAVRGKHLCLAVPPRLAAVQRGRGGGGVQARARLWPPGRL